MVSKNYTDTGQFLTFFGYSGIFFSKSSKFYSKFSKNYSEIAEKSKKLSVQFLLYHLPVYFY